MTAARRLAAILAADVVGYSRLMGEDEAGTAKIVRERREAATPILRVFGGRLVKTTGDGVLLEFPSVVAAVECAILIQKMMGERNAALPDAKRILYRMGVNLGDIQARKQVLFGLFSPLGQPLALNSPNQVMQACFELRPCDDVRSSISASSLRQ